MYKVGCGSKIAWQTKGILQTIFDIRWFQDWFPCLVSPLGVKHTGRALIHLEMSVQLNLTIRLEGQHKVRIFCFALTVTKNQLSHLK